MAMTDPLGDMLTRIRNGQQAKKDSVLSPASKLRANVLEVLQREGYIRGYSEDNSGPHKALRIELKYFEGEAAIKHVAITSGVTAQIDNGTLTVKDPKGTLTLGLSDHVQYTIDGEAISIKPAN